MGIFIGKVKNVNVMFKAIPVKINKNNICKGIFQMVSTC